MHPDFFGDSYDLVKHTLLRWLSPMGEWAVHPMFREDFDEEFVQAYEDLLGACTITQAPIPRGRHRHAHLHLADEYDNVLFDPDTGIKSGLRITRRHLMLAELIELANARAHSLTLVFDQSLSRGQERPVLEQKVAALRANGLSAFGYFSHACFVAVSRSHDRLVEAQTLIAKAGVPPWRIV